MVRSKQNMVEKAQAKVLVIGSGGMLGRALVSVVSRSFLTTGLSHDDLDITDLKKTKNICAQIKPAVIVLAASYTDVDGCERNKSLADRVNTQGVKNVALAAQMTKAILILVSTDYVFNGRKRSLYNEKDAPDPVSIYGASKLKGEEIVRRLIPKSVIVRCSLLFGEGKKGFVAMALDRLNKKEPIKAVFDKIASPTYVVDLAIAIAEVLRLIVSNRYDFKKNKILHIVNKGACSWYDMAKYIVDARGNRAVKVEKIKLDDFPFIAKRPRYSALDPARYEKLIGKPLRPWQEALSEFIRCQSS